MGAPLDALRASDGVAPAVRATISSVRLPGDMDIITDSVANWPHKGIATSGTPDDDGVIIPDTVCVFEYVLSGSIIHITGFAPGYYDIGHTENQICIIKPTTYHNDSIVEMLEEGGASVTISDTPPAGAEPGDMWGDTSDSGINDLVIAVGSMLMPIGQSIITINPANPATYYGFGTWVEDVKGRTIVGVDSTQTEFDTVGETGGTKTETLTTAQTPAHDHTMLGLGVQYVGSGGEIGLGGGTAWTPSDRASIPAHLRNARTNAVGSGLPHNNLQPYKTKHIWTRTA